MAKSATPEGKAPAGHWSVRDTNARELDGAGNVLPRMHEAAPGAMYALYFDRDTAMPEQHARVFLKDPAFKVLDAEGDPVAGLNPDAMTRVMPNRLAPGTVIASLEELTLDALLTRSAQLPDRPKFTVRSKRETVIEFIRDAMDGGAHASGGYGGSDQGLIEGPDDSALEVEDADDDDAAEILKGR